MSRIIREMIDSLTLRFERLSDREKKMTAILLITLVVFIVGGSLYWVSSSAISSSKQIGLAEKRFLQINSLKGQYVAAKKIAEAQEKRFKTNKISLFSLIQNSATRYGLSLHDLNERKEPIDKSNLMEVSVVVNLKEVSVDRLTAFIQALEESEGKMVKIIKLKIKSRYDKSNLLDVQMTVATWKTA